MNVSLPPVLKRIVDDRVSSGVYGSASEFVREAIREKLQFEQDRAAARRELSRKLIAGLNSGAPLPVDAAYFRGKKRALSRRSPRPAAK